MMYILFLLFAIYSQIFCDNKETVERILNLIHGRHLNTGDMRQTANIKFITQKVDHFKEDDKREWKMRYVSEELNFEPGNPMFIYVCGEWAVTEDVGRVSLVYDMVKEHKGHLFFTEHRFYGESFPTKDMDVENIQYLRVKQALKDLAHFINNIKTTDTRFAKSKVILIGSSYTGALVTWFTKLYPELVAGAWASGGPLIARAIFKEYKVGVGASIREIGGEKCLNRIAAAINKLERQIYEDPESIKKNLRLCPNVDLHDELDVWQIFSSFTGLFTNLVQKHSYNNQEIQKACQIINSGENDVAGLIAWFSAISDPENTGQCLLASFADTVKFLKITVPNPTIHRQWAYQLCTDLGWFHTSDSIDQPFGKYFPADYFFYLCKELFGTKYTNKFIHETKEETNLSFDTNNLKKLKNVVWSYGGLDPWRLLGMQETDGQSNVVPLYSHCQDFNSISDNDTVAMKANKHRILEQIKKFLS